MIQEFDFGVIGSGPAGHTAALLAKKQGKTVVLFEKDLLGGVCLNRGCIPTKTLLHSANIYETNKNCDKYGIIINENSIDFTKVVTQKENVITNLRKNLEHSLKSSGINIVNSEAKLLDKNIITADNKTYKCQKIIVATGSKPKEIKGMEYDHKLILSSDDILALTILPKNIVIVGSGAIGIEFARILSAFDVDVTVIEIAENLLPLADIDISKRIARLFKTKQIKFYTKTSVTQIEKHQNSVNILLDNGENIVSDCVLLAVGRVPDMVEKFEGVTYIGDVTNSIQLAHFANKEAMATICDIPFNKELIPSVVYGEPEIAWIGKREQDLEDGTYKKSIIPISALAKAQCDGKTDGMIKILTCDDKIIGAHLMTSEASSLIQQLVIAMQMNLTVTQLKSVCFAHPTYSEGILECLMRLQ